MNKSFVITGLLLILCATPCRAGFIIAEKLAKDCQNEKCTAYIQGAVDALLYMRPRSICIPLKTSAGQIESIVKKYAAAHPEGWRRNAGGEIYKALCEAYPCR
ncbi:MAG: hypothetical protein EPN21_09820 [Methylococcaceae bacterium]|nr:MAG: hypothetical protein EPN21_09820 [Methylococcaceae bacterium]